MSRLDQHVQSLQTRLFAGLFVEALALAALVLAGAYELALLIGRVFNAYLPWPELCVAGGALAGVLGCAIYAELRRPGEHATAARLDQALGLKERFSTALYARGSSDDFARAAVADAEHLADSVSLRKRFPMAFPQLGYYALAVAVVAVLTHLLVPQWDVLGREQAKLQQATARMQAEDARKKVEKALVEVEQMPKVLANDPSIKAAREELRALLDKPIDDPTAASTTAQRALQDAQALRDRIKDNQHVADAEAQRKMLNNMLTSNKPFEQLEAAKQSLAKSDFAAAAQAMQLAAEKFQNSDEGTREEMSKEMAALSQMMQKAATDPAVQKQIADNLKKLGADQQQAKQIMDQMQQAAAGDKQAAQRLANMAQNMARQQNGGKLPAPAQLAAVMQQMQQMQGQMNAQQQAQQMAQAAQQMAQAMQQAANAQQQAPGQQGQGKQGGQQSGQQGGQKQAGGRQGQQPGGKDGTGGQDGQSGDSQQQMADAQKAMQDAIKQMQAAQQDAQQAQAAQKEGDGKEGQGDAQWGDQQGNQPGPGRGKGGNGPAGWNQGGQASGDRNYETPAPFGTKKENSPGERDAKGQILAGWFVKADAIKGDSHEKLKEVLASAEKDQADEIDQDRIPLSSQKVVRDYFNSMKDNAPPAK